MKRSLLVSFWMTLFITTIFAQVLSFPPNPKQLDKLFRQGELAIILENQDYEK